MLITPNLPFFHHRAALNNSIKVVPTFKVSFDEHHYFNLNEGGIDHLLIILSI